MKETTAVTIVNLGVMLLTGFIFWMTKSWWSLIVLVCLFRTSKEDGE